MTRVSSSVKGRIFPLLEYRILVPGSPETEISHQLLPGNPNARLCSRFPLVPHASPRSLEDRRGKKAAGQETIEIGSVPCCFRS